MVSAFVDGEILQATWIWDVLGENMVVSIKVPESWMVYVMEKSIYNRMTETGTPISGNLHMEGDHQPYVGGKNQNQQKSGMIMIDNSSQ